MFLNLQDEFGNELGKDYNGKVKVQITSDSEVDEVPRFSDGKQSVEFPLIKGQCRLQVSDLNNLGFWKLGLSPDSYK